MLCVLELDFDTMTMLVSAPVAKMERLRDTLSEWPSDCAVESEAELRSLTGWLLPICEMVWPGFFSARV